MPTRRPLRFAATLLCVVVVAGLCACQQEKRNVETSDAHFSDSVVPADEFATGTNKPPSAQTLHSMARILVKQQKDDQAEYILKRSIKSYPEFLPAYSDLGALYMRQDRPDSAIEILNSARKIAPRDAVVLNNLGMCHMVKGDYAAALTAIEGACDADPKNARYQANRGTALGLLGHDAEAMDVFKKVLTPAEAHYNMAVILESRKLPERAREEYKLAEQLGLKRSVPGAEAQGATAAP